jgi:hypothetical protein
LRQAKADLDAVCKQLDPFFQKTGFGNDELSEPARLAIRQALDQRPAILPLLKQAATCQDCDVQADYNHGPVAFEASVRVGVLPWRQAASVLSARARLLAAQGDLVESSNCCVILLRLARHVERGPLLNSYLTAQACKGIAFEALNVLLRCPQLDKHARDMIDTALDECEDPSGYRWALRSERAYELDSLNRFNLFLQVTMAGDTRVFLDFMESQIALAEATYARAADSSSKGTKGARGLLSLSIPAIMKVRAAKDRVLAEARCLRVLNALERHKVSSDAARALTGLRLPRQGLLDPFSGDLLHVKRVSGGWLIYSVGEDMVDNGGDIARHKDAGVGPVKAVTKKKLWKYM